MGPIEASIRERAIEARRRLAGHVPVQVIERLALMAATPRHRPAERAPIAAPERAPEESAYLPSEIPTPGASSAAIIKEVSLKHGVSVDDMISEIRSVPVVGARYEAIYRIREERHLSWAQIGRLFNRDHSTILHGWRMHRERNPEVVA